MLDDNVDKNDIFILKMPAYIRAGLDLETLLWADISHHLSQGWIAASLPFWTKLSAVRRAWRRAEKPDPVCERVAVFFHDSSLLSWRKAAKETQTELIKEGQTAPDFSLTSALLTDLIIFKYISTFLKHLWAKVDC